MHSMPVTIIRIFGVNPSMRIYSNNPIGACNAYTVAGFVEIPCIILRYTISDDHLFKLIKMSL